MNGTRGANGRLGIKRSRGTHRPLGRNESRGPTRTPGINGPRRRWNDVRAALSALIDLVFPLRCPGCDGPGTSWCAHCARELGGLRRVERPLLPTSMPAFALGPYTGAPRRAVLAYKEYGRRDLAEPFARALSTGARAVTDLLGIAPHQPLCLVPAPSRASAARRRGGSHVLRFARRCAQLLSESDRPAGVADCLVMREGVRDSVGLGPHERARNLAGGLSLRADRAPPDGSAVVLVDDVITTAATAVSCLAVLREAGSPPRAVVALTATPG